VSTAHIQQALARLDELTRRLRAECPWDREQDERSIVPHTVEEAYELADAAHARDDAKLLDELGDVLFQVHFLALLLEERGAGDLAAVADHCAEKLIRRHPHVFGEAEVRGAADVLRNWDAIKREEPGRERGPFGDVPENLPGLLHARKVQRRAASGGFDFPDVDAPLASLREELDELEAALAEPPGAPDPGETVRRGQRGPQAQARSRTGAARRQRALSRARAGGDGPRRAGGGDVVGARPRAPAQSLRCRATARRQGTAQGGMT
jgi:NTP pyrophosphatase (non-canonical NTP hydrolase)